MNLKMCLINDNQNNPNLMKMLDVGHVESQHITLTQIGYAIVCLAKKHIGFPGAGGLNPGHH